MSPLSSIYDEIDLQKQVKVLEKSNEKLVRELKNVNLRLEESEALKSHFISNISNEIVNPFTSINGLSKTILETGHEDWKKVITMVAMIHSEALNLDFQLRNIFMAARIEAGETEQDISKTDVKQLIEDVIDTFHIEAKKRKIEIRYINQLPVSQNGPFYFQSDAEIIRLMLINLLSNAIKYSFDFSPVEITSCIQDHELVLSVKDYGKGISTANQNVIFDRFKGLDSGINTLYRGHGLGLSINKALLDILGGRIQVTSEKNEGSLFAIYIPKATEESNITSLTGTKFLFNDMDDEKLF